MMVVQGKAIIMPTIPIKAPQMERDNKMMAGFNPVILPMTFGTMMESWMTWTIQKTNPADASIHQKFCPVSAALSKANNTVGTSAINWR